MASKDAKPTGRFVILVCDDLAKEGLQFFEAHPDRFEVRVKLKLPLAELKKAIEDADACVVRSGTQITREVIEAAPRLKVIGRAGVGLDNVDVEAASKRGVVVINTPGGNTISAAEHAFSLMMAMARSIPAANESLRKGEWERKKFVGVELYEKTLGILGLGRIGTEVAKRAQAFGMRCIAYDPFLRAEKAQQLGVEVVSLDEAIERSDFLTLHLPLTVENRNLIGAPQLARMKKTARIINCARGGLIDEKALAEAIRSGRIAGAAIDVFESEPPTDFELVRLPQVVSTPHLGASTEEAQIAVAVDVAQSLADYLLGRGIKNAVNVPSLDPELAKELEPFIRLSEKLGSLQSQLLEGQLRQVDIRYFGEMSRYETTPMTVAVIKGLLTPILADTVNHVNASFLAKERGIKITESKTSDAENFSSLIEVDVVTDRRRYSVAGTLFTREEPRIVAINAFDVEVVPEGFLLMISNRDVPGIVGQIGTLLGTNQINIAGMTLGRDVPGGQATTVVKVDGIVPERVMQEIKKAPNILDARLIRL